MSKDCLNVAEDIISQNLTKNLTQDIDEQNVYISSSKAWPETVNINRDAHLAEMEGIRLDQGKAMPLYLAAYITNEGDAKFQGEFLWSTICFEVDTGCDRTIMSVKKCKEHDLIMRVFEKPRVVSGVGSARIECAFYTIFRLNTKDLNLFILAYVTEGCPTLLGNDVICYPKNSCKINFESHECKIKGHDVTLFPTEKEAKDYLMIGDNDMIIKLKKFGESIKVRAKEKVNMEAKSAMRIPVILSKPVEIDGIHSYQSATLTKNNVYSIDVMIPCIQENYTVVLINDNHHSVSISNEEILGEIDQIGETIQEGEEQITRIFSVETLRQDMQLEGSKSLESERPMDASKLQAEASTSIES